MNRMEHVWRLLKRMHWPMLVPLALALAAGVLFIYSACYVSDDLPVKTLYRKQIFWIGIGTVGYFVAALYDYRRLGRWAWALYIGAVAMLILVLTTGRTIYGARRWLMVPGTGFGIQPSEPAKLATLIFLAHLLSLPEVDTTRFRTFAGILLVVAAPLLLVLNQPDLGSSLVFVPPMLVMLFVGGAPLKYVGGLVAAGLLMAALVMGGIVLPEVLELDESLRTRIEQAVPLSGYQQERIRTLIWPKRDPLGAGWNRTQSGIAVGSGGLWGKGFLKGTQNILGFLPRSVAPTDFIYSVIAEETGFAGATAVLLLFAALLLCGWHIAINSPETMGRLLATGILTMLFFHVWINVAMTVGIMPIVGLPLPLFSYGGSFLVTTMVALGLLQSVYVRSPRRLLL